MLPYKHFTIEERKALHEMIRQGQGVRQMADALGRSPSSVSREIQRNSSKNGYHYWRAQTLTICRRRERKRRALCSGTEEWAYIIAKLKLFWPPETISARWKLEHAERKALSSSTIYRYIERHELPGITRKENLRRRGKRKYDRNANFNSIQPDRIIPDWPQEIVNRMRIGDWEGDTVYGGTGKGLLVSLVDRRSRYLLAGLLKSRDRNETKNVMISLLSRLPVNSISLDNGSEFAQFHAVEAALHTRVYFAEPHKPWQRGTNENTNGMLRFFFPKGFDFLSLSPEELASVVDLLNHRPRKCLGWRSPHEVFFSSAPVALT